MLAYRKLVFRSLIGLVLIGSGVALIVASGGGGDSGSSSGGRTFSLPAGIQAQSIIGDSYNWGRRCSVAGNGTRSANFIYMTLVNTTSIAIQVTIPAGLIFIPEPDPGNPQQMMVTQDNTIIVGTGAHSFCIWVNCVGGGARARDEFRYQFGPFVEDECRWEIINLLRGKHLSAMQRIDAVKIFDMIRSCPDRGGLTDEDREFLRSLP